MILKGHTCRVHVTYICAMSSSLQVAYSPPPTSLPPSSLLTHSSSNGGMYCRPFSDPDYYTPTMVLTYEL